MGLPPPHSLQMPITRLKQEMKLPHALIRALSKKGIEKPTPIQVQACPPCSAAGHDRHRLHRQRQDPGVQPCRLIMFCMEQERNLPFSRGEGPYGLILCPSRELARQTHDIMEGFPSLKVAALIGGVNAKEQADSMKFGVHIVAFAAPRSPQVCRYICLDEADRVVDSTFEEDMRTIFSYFKAQRQTLLFSATMPKKIQQFALSALVDPVSVNSINVTRSRWKYAKVARGQDAQEGPLQKTPARADLRREEGGRGRHSRVPAHQGRRCWMSIHGGKDQEERKLSFDAFRHARTRDVLHVITMTCRRDIENYVCIALAELAGGHSGASPPLLLTD
uniref:RNA helicase n=1 Tax=Macrostomum lignano TaxID=282301 RepID=A0A1I8F9D1_9PLAT